MKIEIAELGTWGNAALLAEYDPEDDTIRIDARVVARVYAALGRTGASDFVRCALAHELFHREHPAASEAQAHAFVREACSLEPQRYEAFARA